MVTSLKFLSVERNTLVASKLHLDANIKVVKDIVRFMTFELGE